MNKNIFVVGLDEFNLNRLRSIRHADRYRFHSALDLKRVQEAKTYPIEDWLRATQEKMDAFEGSVDAVIGFWDFPVSPMVPILCERYNTRGPSLRSVLRCEHKYWSRLEQRRVIPEQVPKFAAVNPFDEESVAALDLDFPLWLKPVKAFASQLGFYVENEEDLKQAIDKLRAGIERFAKPFNAVLSRIEVPEEAGGVDGYWAVAEEIMRGRQLTIAGYVNDRGVHTYGLIDSINYPGSTSFFRYQYPSRLPEDVRERAADISKRVMAHMKFDHSPFNIEYFYDEERDHLSLLEINTRISQSHSYLFEQVDGASNHQVLVELALGNSPKFPRNEGPHRYCNKLHLRHFEDGTVTRVPGEENIEKVRAEFPDARVLVQVTDGVRLGELGNQDAYSTRLAVVYLGAKNEDELLSKYERAIDMLGFEVDGRKVEAKKSDLR